MQTIAEVIILDNGFYGYPIGLGLLFNENPDTKEYFLSLPEETQQALINQEIHSSEDLNDCIERLKMKE